MASGRVADRERFVRDFLRYHGARLAGAPHGYLVAELPPALARRLRASRIEAVFKGADVSDHPGATLMAPGTPLFDRMLRLARRGGGVSRRCVARDRGLEPAARLDAAGPLLAAARPGAPLYRARLLFTFRIAYRAFEGFDDIRAIAVDATTRAVADGRDFFSGQNLMDDPEPEVSPPAAADVGALLRAALADLERRAGHAVARFAQRAEAQLSRETEELRKFYTALIDEEKLRLARRRLTGAVAAAEPKLEWVQRLHRELRLFAPRMTVSLLGLEELWVPVLPLDLPLDGAPGEVALDLATGDIIGLACQVCGLEIAPPLATCSREHVLCTACIQECQRCRSSFCLLCLRAPGVAGPEVVCYDPASRNPEASATCPACAPAGEPHVRQGRRGS